MTGTDANDRDAARGATEGDVHAPGVLGDVPRVSGARLARYAEAIWGKANTNAAARAVMAVADAEQAGLKAEVERLTSERNIAVNTVKATTPNFDVVAARIQCEQREAADRRAWAAEAKLRDVEAVLDRVEREQAAGDEWDVDEVVHDVRLAVLVESQAPAERLREELAEGKDAAADVLSAWRRMRGAAFAAEAALTSEREAHAGLRARVRAIGGRVSEFCEAVESECDPAADLCHDHDRTDEGGCALATDLEAIATDLLRALAAEPAAPVAAEEGGEQEAGEGGIAAVSTRGWAGNLPRPMRMLMREVALFRPVRVRRHQGRCVSHG